MVEIMHTHRMCTPFLKGHVIFCVATKCIKNFGSKFPSLLEHNACVLLDMQNAYALSFLHNKDESTKHG